MGTPNIVLPISEASAREIDLIPIWRYAGCYPQALEILEACRESPTVSGLAKLITHRFEGIDSVPAALRTACLSMDEERKMVVKVAVTNAV
jgi:L-iditol 2-dehydrogenase